MLKCQIPNASSAVRSFAKLAAEPKSRHWVNHLTTRPLFANLLDQDHELRGDVFLAGGYTDAKQIGHLLFTLKASGIGTYSPTKTRTGFISPICC